MIVAPAIDLREGRCVQLVGGRPERERVSLPDPLRVAERWQAVGFDTLHVVDLDAALGVGDNVAVVERLIRSTTALVQVGGGVRDDERAAALLDIGAGRVIVGTRAVDDPQWLARLAARRPGHVMVALDVRDGRVLTRGWTAEDQLGLEAHRERLAELPLAGVLTTDVDREGRLTGVDRERAVRDAAACPHPLWIAGGIHGEDDLEHLDAAGAAGAVLGMALYTGALDPRAVADRWGGRAAAAERPPPKPSRASALERR